MSLLESALAYADLGWHVFPLKPGGKTPITRNGHRDATTDTTKIKEWWLKSPQANIGIATGGASSIWVLDVDVDQAKNIDGDAALVELEDRLGVLPPTLTQRTPRGGQHLVFRHPGFRVKSSAGKLGTGLDVRGDGGYVVAAPSIGPGGRKYAWAEGLKVSADLIADAPAWLIERVVPTTPKQKSQDRKAAQRSSEHPAPSSEAFCYARVALDREIADVRNANKGTRNHVLNKASFALGQLVGAGALSEGNVHARLMAAAAAIGLPQKEAEKTIESGLKAGMEAPRELPKLISTSGGGRSNKPPADAKRKNASGPPAVDFTDDGIAKQLVDKMVGKVAYVASRKKWMVWDGKRWCEDDTLQVQEVARMVCREIGALAYTPRLMRSVRSATTVRAVMTLARGDRRIAATADQWDSDDWKLNTPSGIIDLKTGEQLPHDPRGFHTKITNATPGGTPAGWLHFLRDVTDKDEEIIGFLKRLSGYALTGSTREHKFVFLHGPGGNGKSTFIDTLLHVMGDYGVNAPMQTFTASRYDRHPTELAMLEGARLVTAQETEQGSSWSEARLKQLTGGDPVTARRMRQDFETFDPKCKHFFSGNNTPSLNTPDDAMRRRIIVIAFLNSIPKHKIDPDLPEKLKREAGAVLQWQIEGCLEYLETGLAIPRSIIAHTEEYLEQEDVFGQWIEENCIVGSHVEAPSSSLRENYNMWARNNNEAELSGRMFSKTLKDRGFKSYHARNHNGFKGIALKPTGYRESDSEEEEVWEH